MKRGLTIIFAFIVTISAYAQYNKEFVVKGKFSGVSEPMDVTLEFREQTLKLVSSDGTFEFKGTSFPTDATLKMLPHHPTLTMEDTAYWSLVSRRQHLIGVRNFFLEGNVNIHGKTINDAIVDGSKEQNLYEDYRYKLRTLSRSLDSIRKANTSKAKKGPSAAELKMRTEINDFKLGFVKRYPDSYFSLDLAKLESREDTTTFESMVNALGESLHETTLYKSLKLMVAGNKMKKIGTKALMFTQNSVNGTPVSLASYKGKYVLVDFWASWCVPCRAENPNLLKAYNKYKTKNFDIISVSVDDSKEKWIQAVKEDKLPWAQLSDLKGGSNAVALAYAVTAVPDNVLLDPNGIIIASNLRGEELEKALEKFIK